MCCGILLRLPAQDRFARLIFALAQTSYEPHPQQPMATLDPRSIIILAGVISLMMALVLLFMRRSYPVAIGGLREWTAAPFFFFASAVFFGLRGTIPDVLSIVVANLLLYIGTVLSYMGSQRFFGKPIRVLPWTLLGLLVVGVLFWWSHFTPVFAPRLVFFNAVLCVVFAFHIRLYLRQNRLSFPGRFMLLILAIQFCSLLARLASVAIGAAGGGLLDASFWSTLYVTVYSFTTLSLAIGAILMATDAVRGEFENLLAHDALTGALSRTAVLKMTARELGRCRRHGRTMSLLLIDLDHFKAINDTHGHLAGDQVLADFVRRTRAQLRTPDRIGRYGGEEFLVVLPETSLNAAAVVAERIRADVSAVHEKLPAYTISVGIASSEEDHANDTVDSLIARADQSMYRAKASGRNRTAWQALL